jgi:hypothetical protein
VAPGQAPCKNIGAFVCFWQLKRIKITGKIIVYSVSLLSERNLKNFGMKTCHLAWWN